MKYRVAAAGPSREAMAATHSLEVVKTSKSGLAAKGRPEWVREDNGHQSKPRASTSLASLRRLIESESANLAGPGCPSRGLKIQEDTGCMPEMHVDLVILSLFQNHEA